MMGKRRKMERRGGEEVEGGEGVAVALQL